MPAIADYELLEQLSQGNHGTWWLATPPARLGRDDNVLVKVLHTEGGEEAFARMVRELRSFAAVQSPNLLSLLDAGHDRGRLFYSAVRPGGGSLERPAVPLTAASATRAVAGAARGVHALHEAGIAHRDITPANVLVADDGTGLLSDLGLVQLLAPGQTQTGIGPIGALQYTDPAVIRGERATRATDLWSLGMTLHRAVVGRSAFPELSSRDLLGAIRTVTTTTPVLAALPPQLLAVAERCVDPDPTARWPTAAALAEALEAIDV